MEDIDKRELSERDICTKFITPAIKQANWKERQIREEVKLTNGRIIVKGSATSRGKPKRADYVLSYKPNIPLAVVEAKKNTHTLGDGMQQALLYAEMLDIPFAFSSNGDAFLFHDRTGTFGKVEEEIPLESFPSPEFLWQKYCEWKELDEGRQKIVTQNYFIDHRKSLRYYQRIAINRTVEAIAKGQNRILLVMATGTGKTLAAFQIIWRLWKAGVKKRILYLADRNILIKQTRINDFKHFGNAMTKIQNHEVEKSYEIYLSLYQAVSGTEEDKNIYKQFSPEFFDLVIIDECHRGSAAEDSAWREILEYFSSATQIGLTATPKETKDVSNIHYFGEPIYTYSLKQGIEDGFLAPYRVIRIDLDKDLAGWRPEKNQVDRYGTPIEDRIYNQKDFDRNLVLEKRTELVAKKVTEFLKANDRFDKTIVFCENIDHAERMREAIVNENPDLAGENRKYVMRITGDNPEGKAELDNFIDPESRYPVIATTSKLMSTGVDAQTCKLIVLDKRIESMTEFKQIIGRGTRINEDYGKFYFTIMDFKKATELFADPDFDGEPVEIYDFEGENGSGKSRDMDEENNREKYFVDDVDVDVVIERTQYYGPDGKLITESLKDYTRKTLLKDFESLDSFLKYWNEAEKKQEIISELEERGVLFDALAEEVGKDLDPFDLVCHVVFDRPPLSRKERAERVKKSDYFSKYGENAQEVLDALLDKYADDGIEDLESLNVLKVQPFDMMGTPLEIIKRFGGKNNYLEAVKGLENQIYTSEV
ncbi:Type I restriction-modification system, restriction subunit R [Methanosarcina barkeri str. Wiesmoor]|uniref:Type I restriction-modification system, restriction subunit R n=1 Tax=Methanosarcina barkeri str. Wiesmoor TaxID=1434109 RepID=A0A0E3QN27_METBA|nr:DEAD/DEAH box helicase family protein [Methanosarcina barkeri]AKB51474.1 Type I restriction-modification system, restriction subunit R [Methanosarcina barkeri str. Wiesmoor]